MAGIVTTLKTGHQRGLIGKQIDDLALAFITPLGAENDYVLTHDC